MKNVEEEFDSTRIGDEFVSRPLGTSPEGPASLNKNVLHKGLDLTSAQKGSKGLKKADLLPNYAISSDCESISEGSSMKISRESASVQSLRDSVYEFGFCSADTSSSSTLILRPSHKKGHDANISPISDSFLDNSSIRQSPTPDLEDDDVLCRPTRRVARVSKGCSPHSTTFQVHPVVLSNFEVSSRNGTFGLDEVGSGSGIPAPVQYGDQGSLCSYEPVVSERFDDKLLVQDSVFDSLNSSSCDIFYSSSQSQPLVALVSKNKQRKKLRSLLWPLIEQEQVTRKDISAF